jgi:MoaA/NifB/PqqE/SkfB family radical SAM enzyme
MSLSTAVEGALARLRPRTADAVSSSITADGPVGDLQFPCAGDGVWQIVTEQGRPCLTPNERSHYVYVEVPPAMRTLAHGRTAWLEVEYFGASYGRFRVQHASTDRGAAHEGLYRAAEQRWNADAAGLSRFRRAVFPLTDFDGTRTQNHGASLRFEFREELLITRVSLSLQEPEAGAFPHLAPLPELKKLPGRQYPITYLFIEITNACNFKCTWCPDEIMERRRGFMKKDRVFRILDEVAAKRPSLGPVFPVKLHQMGEPFLHPDLVEIVARAEGHGVPIELNTNCGLITQSNIDGLYKAGCTNIILSYQTPDPESFKTRKAPRIAFEEYREKVRLAVARKFALGARTQLEIDIMNTKYVKDYQIVAGDTEAVAFVKEWIDFAQAIEKEHGLTPRVHDWDRLHTLNFLDQDENGSRYTLLDGVSLIWKRCHSWGNVIGEHKLYDVKDTYCPAPYEQLVIQWNGDVVTCCTDYEGRTKTSNVFAESVEAVWTGDVLKSRKKDMLAGRLLDVCARCQGVK